MAKLVRRKPRFQDAEAAPPTAAPEAAVHPTNGARRGRLGDLLLRDRALEPEELETALREQVESGRRLGQLLLEQGLIAEAALAKVLAEQLALPLADLGRDRPDQNAVDLLHEDVARAHGAVPLRATPEEVHVVMADPTDEARAAVTAAVGRPVSFMVAPAGEIRQAIDKAYRAIGGVDGLIKAFEATEATRAGPQTIDASDTGADGPVVRIVNVLLTQALRDRASDIHIEPQSEQLRVRFRVDGALHDALDIPAHIGPALISRLKILAGMNIVERRRPHDGQFTTNADGRDVDVRVATVATIWGEKCVLRLLDKGRRLLFLNDLGMPPDTHETFSKMARTPFGMVLCAGPTGSGKTTTLYATLAELNEPHRNIMTIEDPVEYVFSGINQIQTSETAGLTFAPGLKSVLRQDPDVILVGECRDVETARIAVQSALTGHFVLSTLHATDSVAAVHRLLDMGIESFLVASSVLGVVGQRLVRRICDSCKTQYKASAEELAFYIEAGGADHDRDTFWHGAGCNFRAGTGYQDRIGVYELLRITPELKRLIVGWATQDELRRLAVSQGMRTLQEEAVALVDRDVTTLAEVIRTIYTL